MFLKLHVGLSMMIGGFVGFILTRGLPAAESTLAATIFEVATSPILVVIPLFVLMGVIAGAGGVIAAAFETFDKWLGHLRGGLAMATVGACAAFGAVCGDNIATAVTMNKAALPSMRKLGYDDKLSFGSIAAGGNLGILIPPSAAFVVYGFITENNIANLFVSGILPGIILTAMFMVDDRDLVQAGPEPVLEARAPDDEGQAGLAQGADRHRRGVPARDGRPHGRRLHAAGGRRRGYGRDDRREPLLPAAHVEEAGRRPGGSRRRPSAMILLLIMGARYFSYFITTTELPQTLSDVILNATSTATS